jgi:riboflavin kinase/FMN adenylyltransferase
MELIRGRHNIKPRHHGCVVTIGNFDGVHLGHQSLLTQVRDLADRYQLPSVVILFEPQSAEYFRGEMAPARLTRLREKYELLRDQAMDRLLVLRFDERLAQLAAESFIDELLLSQLGMRALVIGDNFRFGTGRAGNMEMLRQFAAEHEFELVQATSFMIGAERVSSTRIRALLWDGAFVDAALLLGRPYTMSGHVIRGQQRGRSMGFPTINIDLHRRRSPLTGIFAARVRGLGPQLLSGAAYIGRRPTLAGDREVLEVHLFDFAADCYGAFVEVEFVAKLRGDVKFDSMEALRRQIDADTRLAKEVLSEQPTA